jgi:hypothetical protein
MQNLCVVEVKKLGCCSTYEQICQWALRAGIVWWAYDLPKTCLPANDLPACLPMTCLPANDLPACQRPANLSPCHPGVLPWRRPA